MPRLLDRGSGPGPRVPLLGAFLVATLCLAAWLGYEAVAAGGSHRQTAEAVLSDYAAIALAAYTRSADAELDDLLGRAFDRVDRGLARGGRLPDPREVGWELDDAAREAGCRGCRAVQRPRLLFAADLGRGYVQAVPDTFSPTRVLALVDTILARSPATGRYHEGLLSLAPGGVQSDAAAVGYALARDSLGGVRAMGFMVGPEALQELFGAWFAARRLLPTPIGGELPNDSLLEVTVRGPGGEVIYTSPRDFPATLVATGSLASEYGELAVEVAMRPDQASQLIIGGLPSSRLPLLAVLLVLTLGIGVATLIQYRRESAFQRLRDDFVSGVSHELRTPLAQIRIFAELQDTGKLESEADRQRANAVIHREARRLSHLVDNILQFSRLRYSDGPDMPREPLDLGAALEEGLDAMSTVLRNRSMTLQVHADPGLRVCANRDALTRVVVNLLDNAAKYGPDGQEVTVQLRRVNGCARLSVQDQGPGVPAADRQRIWKPYRRLERDIRARLPGTGLGLAVVAELAAAQGGRAWVEPAQNSAEGPAERRAEQSAELAAEGPGARFVVELPLHAGQEAAPNGGGGRHA